MIEILSIDSIKTKEYSMWYRYEGFTSQKQFIVENNKVSPSSKISYVCPCCEKDTTTMLRTFNDRIGKFYEISGYWYLCKKCTYIYADKSDFARKQEITKTKNGTRPRDILQKTGKLGFIGMDQ